MITEIVNNEKIMNLLMIMETLIKKIMIMSAKK